MTKPRLMLDDDQRSDGVFLYGDFCAAGQGFRLCGGAIPPASIENDFGRIRQLVQPRTQRLTAHLLIQRVRQRIVNRIRHLNRAAFRIAQVVQNVHPRVADNRVAPAAGLRHALTERRRYKLLIPHDRITVHLIPHGQEIRIVKRRVGVVLRHQRLEGFQ